MSQFDWGVIDPNAKSGPQLAIDLNNFRDALNTMHRGAERPAYAQGGTLWVKEVSADRWDLNLFDGDNDFVIRSINPQTNELIKIPTAQIDGLDSALAIALKKDAATETGAALIPVGTSAQRPAAPENGMLRYNTPDARYEGFIAGSWQGLVHLGDVGYTIIYPNGGNEATPANAAINSRYVSDNPFPGHRVFCLAEIQIAGKWGPTGWIYSAGGFGTLASQYDDDKIVTQTGGSAVMSGASNVSGNPHGTNGSQYTSAPVRVKVWRVRG